MLNVLLWNTNRKREAAAICSDIAASRGSNLLIVLEGAEFRADYLDALNNDGQGLWHYNPGLCRRVDLYSRFEPQHIEAISESEHYTARIVSSPGFPPILLVALHLRSRLHMTPDSKHTEAFVTMNAIKKMEQEVGHQRTIIAGDFNMDPFEAGMLSSSGFHALGSRRTVADRQRVVHGVAYDYFFNPMWRLWSDGADRPEASYRYWDAQPVCQEWHMFDQVILRPDLMDWLTHGSLEVISSSSSCKLTSTRGIPSVSDHLPIAFQLTRPEHARCP